jgi:hypothetical protein
MSPFARIRRAAVLGATLALVAAASACSNPRQAAYLNDQMNQAADAVADIRTSMSILQSSIDSLRLVVAKQDSTIAKIAAVTNVPIVK